MTRLLILSLMLSRLALCALVLAACASTGPVYTEAPLPPILAGTIARLVVDGPDARINGQPAQTGRYVRDGDIVSTGAATSAKLKLNDGGEIQLDENTDPLFKQGVCLFMKVWRGRVAFYNLNCQEFEDGLNMRGVARSFVHIESASAGSRVTVITGEVDMRSPSPAVVGVDMQYAATRDGAVQLLKLTPEEAAATVAWTRNYFRPRPTRGSEGLSNTEAGILGGIGAGILDYVFRNKGGRRQSRTRPGTTRPPETGQPPETTRPPETRQPPEPVRPPETTQPPAPARLPETAPVPQTQPVPGRVEGRVPEQAKQVPPPVN